MKKKYYLILDTETATLPFANQIAETVTDKRKIAIAKPLVYDIGWIVMDREGIIVKKENFLVQETFFVPSIFNTAYYKGKRSLYIQAMKEGKIKVKDWDSIIAILLEDLRSVDLVSAYNYCFDKKAISFTENYINALYSFSYQEWENSELKACISILKGEGKKTKSNSEFLQPILKLRGETFPALDLWGLSCNKLINKNKYKKYCLENNLLTNSGLYFKTSAETSFQYLQKCYDFVEQHTALNDAEIEGIILAKVLKKGKVEPSIEPFPFQALGKTVDFIQLKNNQKFADVVIQALQQYLESQTKNSSYTRYIQNILYELKGSKENDN